MVYILVYKKFFFTNSVVILTEGGNELGYGHLMRCLAIAHGFIEMNIDSVFYLRGEPAVEEILKGFSFHLIDWTEQPVDVKDKIVIVDSYYADENACRKVYKDAKAVLFIDDYNRIPYPGGFVLNSVVGAETLCYPDNPDLIYLLGQKYHPLRREFWDVPEKVINDKVGKILITFGGSDITNHTPVVLKILNYKYSDLEKHVIVGKGYSNIDVIEAEADEKTVLIFYPDAERMKQEMVECDIAISGAGQTLAELARVGVPTYCIKVADNQDVNIQNWKKTGFIMEGDIYNGMPDLSDRRNSSFKGRSIIDGLGVKRCVELLLNV